VFGKRHWFVGRFFDIAPSLGDALPFLGWGPATHEKIQRNVIFVKEMVKFWMLYQPLAKVRDVAGKVFNNGRPGKRDLARLSSDRDHVRNICA
jgi:hypothetical protein